MSELVSIIGSGFSIYAGLPLARDINQSFERDNFIFDAGPHMIGNYNKGGLLYKMLKDLNIN